MLEAYWAYADFREDCGSGGGNRFVMWRRRWSGPSVSNIASAEGNVTRTINLTRPWRRARYHDLVRETAGVDWFEISSEQRRERAKKLGVEILPQLADFEVTRHVFEKLVEEKAFDPLLSRIVPRNWCRCETKSGAVRLVDVYELIINGVKKIRLVTPS